MKMATNYRRITIDLLKIATERWSAAFAIGYSELTERANKEFKTEEEARTWIKEQITSLL
jgi:hypothetical protein